ncbi:hypothetical protein NKH18_11335 [Streptomyces sp. M10(2022)]
MHGARAIAAAIAEALAGADVDTAVNAALEQLPEGTEIARNAVHAVRIARTSPVKRRAPSPSYPYSSTRSSTTSTATGSRRPRPCRSPSRWPPPPAGDRPGRARGGLSVPGRRLRAGPGRALTGALGGIGTVPAGWREACRTLAGARCPVSRAPISSNSPDCWQRRNRPPGWTIQA